MGTKRSPGAYDCYANAKPDEPMFVLLGRDERAPALVHAWAAVSRGSVALLVRSFGELAILAAQRRIDGRLSAATKVIEAIDCARHMRLWRSLNG